MSHDRIEREIVIEAPGERVRAVLTEHEHVARWFGDSAGLDLRPGGKAAFGWSEEVTGKFHAVIERVEPPSFFACRWARKTEVAPTDGEATLVQFTLTPAGSGTLLRVIETGFASLNATADEQVTSAEENAKGWTAELAELKEFAERLPAERLPA